MNLAKKIAFNTIIQTTSKVISTVLGLITIAMLARYLGRGGFGEYTTIITFISFFAVIADLGLTLVTVQMISLPEADEEHILGNLFSLRLVSALIFLGLAPIVVLFFPYSHAIKLGVLIATVSFLFPALNQILVGLFQKRLRLDKVSIAEVASRLVLLVGTFLTLKFDLGLRGILVTMVISSGLNFFILYYFAEKFVKIRLKFDRQLWLKIVSKTWPIGITIFFNLIYLRADTLIMSLVKTQEEVGLYGAAYRVIDVLITLPFIFAGIVLPIMTANWLQDKARFKNILQKSFNLMAIVGIPIAIGAQFVSHRLIVLVAGEEFLIAGNILNVLILAASIIFIGTIFSHAVIAIDKQKQIIKAYAFVAVTALIGYFYFIPLYSYYGAAWVTIYSELAIAIAAAWLVWHETGFKPSLTITFKALIASAVMSLVLFFFSNLNLLLLIILAVISYFIGLYLVKGVTKEEILELVTKG